MFPALSVFVAVFCWLGCIQAQLPVPRNVDQIILNSETQFPPEEYVSLPLDHTAANKTALTFQNLYFVNHEWYKRGGPVFLFDGGEGAAPNGSIAHSKNDPAASLTFIENLAKIHGGMIIAWEHRYYGKSLPPGVDLKKCMEVDFRYLNTRQALDDVAYFANSFTRNQSNPLFKGLDLTPKKTPWIFVGGSYPGARAAMMRVVYPDVIFASYASSAPVQATVDMFMYYDPIWKGLQRYGFTNCSVDMHAAIVAIDERLSRDAATADQIKQKISKCPNPQMSNGRFAQRLSMLWNSWQDSGVGSESSQSSIRSLCDHISLNPTTNKYSGIGGWASTQGVDFTLDRLSSWPGLKELKVFSRCGWLRQECNPDTEIDYISWDYQYCTEYGYFQTGRPGDSQIVSKYYDVKYFHDDCLCQFKPSGAERVIPPLPKAEFINTQFGGATMRPSRTFWTNGEFDPWNTLSPLKTSNPVITECEASTRPWSLMFGYVLKDAQHAEDMRDVETSEAKEAHRLFSAALNKWLCCFAERDRSKINDGAKAVLCPAGKVSGSQVEGEVIDEL